MQAARSLTQILTLRIPGYEAKDPRTKKIRLMPCVLSWNNVLQLEHHARSSLKLKIQRAFLSALRASASASSTPTTCAKSTYATLAATLELYLETALEQRKLKSRNARLERAKKSTPS